uniref:Uncharacterized protein n=1 Tax=Amphilophus citrinellus TaxID=61819 RepID=A0A3Q0T3K5_AMPCI
TFKFGHDRFGSVTQSAYLSSCSVFTSVLHTDAAVVWFGPYVFTQPGLTAVRAIVTNANLLIRAHEHEFSLFFVLLHLSPHVCSVCLLGWVFC